MAIGFNREIIRRFSEQEAGHLALVFDVLLALALLCGAARRITLDDENFCIFWRAFLAICQFSRQRHTVERALAADQFPRTPRCFPCAGGFERLSNDLLAK